MERHGLAEGHLVNSDDLLLDERAGSLDESVGLVFFHTVWERAVSIYVANIREAD